MAIVLERSLGGQGHQPTAPDKHISNESELGFTQAFAVTLSDSVDLPNGACDALAATVAGVVKVTLMNGTTCIIPIAAGSPLRVQATRVWATGTTATGVVAYN